MAPIDRSIDNSMESHIPMKVWAGMFGGVLCGLVGFLLGATIAWTLGREMFLGKDYCIWDIFGPKSCIFVGAGIGFLLFLCCGCLFCGPCTYFFERLYAFLWPFPSKERVAAMGHHGLSTFDLFITVHRCQNVQNNEGIMGFFGKTNDSFIEVQVGQIIADDFHPGINPRKNTCVQTNNVFEECFLFKIAATDSVIKVALFDQDLVGSAIAGNVLIDIMKDVIDQGFPQVKGYSLQVKDSYSWAAGDAEDAKVGTVVLSFTPGENFPKTLLKQMAGTKQFAFERTLLAASDLKHKSEKEGDYGTWARTSKKEHNSPFFSV